MDAAALASLTPTERDVLRRLAAGKRPGEIARDLARSVSTVNNHLQAARNKLGAPDSLTAARALVGIESPGQNMPRHELPMAALPTPGATITAPPQPAEPWQGVMLNEERARFDHGPSLARGRAELEVASWRNGIEPSAWRRAAAVLGLTLLMLACIALAPAMAETFQLIIDRLYPLNR